MKHYAQIKINGLELQVNLGWPSGERKKPQIVKLDVAIDFPTPPLGCMTSGGAIYQQAKLMPNQTAAFAMRGILSSFLKVLTKRDQALGLFFFS